MDLTLSGRVAIVTGAGGGLGRAHALELASRGAHVVVNDLGGTLSGAGSTATAAEAVADEIRTAGGKAVASAHSVASPEEAEALVALAVSEFGRVDVVVNNAGILRDRSMGKLDWDDVAAVLGVHLQGAFYVTQPAFRHMREQGHGRLVFTSSNATFGNFGQSAYAAAKAGLVGLSNVLAIEGERFGITSNVICPVARTRMTEAVLGDLAEALDPELVSPLVAYLASDECHLTHSVISAGGGHFAGVATSLAAGWQAPRGATAEDLADHLDEILDFDGSTTPRSAAEEVELLRAHLA